MIKDIVAIGDKLELRRLSSENATSGRGKVYVSQLLDLIDNDKAIIAMPIEKSHIVPLSVGEKYTISFYTGKGLYQCNAIIFNRYKIKQIYVLEVQFISGIEKNQRRQYFRLSCIVDTLYHVITREEIVLEKKYNNTAYIDDTEKNKDYENLEELKKVWYEGTITDLSGGGAKFVSNRAHEPGENIILSISLGINAENKKVPSKIVASAKMLNRAGFYEHRVQFTDINREDREAVIKFIFAEERRQRKREKGLD
jgi:c-di-GMP-binding flagellar brake protein YcgR